MTETPKDPAQTDETAAEVQATIGLLLAAGTTSAALSAVATFTGLGLAPLTAAYKVMMGDNLSGQIKATSTVFPWLFEGREGFAPRTATLITRRQNTMYRVAFWLASSRRLARAAKVGADAFKRQVAQERIYWGMHRQADGKRTKAASLVTKVAGSVASGDSPLMLGWYAKDDERTSAECRAAHGRNFLVAKPPVIGYPGAVHPHCRCVPVPPYPGAKMVDDSLTVRRHRSLGSAF